VSESNLHREEDRQSFANQSKNTLIEEILLLRARVEAFERPRPQAEDDNQRLLKSFGHMGELILDTLNRDEIVERLAWHIVQAGHFRSLMVAAVDEEQHHIEVVANYVCVRNYPENPRFTPGGTSITSVPTVSVNKAGRVLRSDEKIVGLKYDLDDNNITPTVARTGQMEVIDGWDQRFDKFSGSSEQMRRNVSYFIPVKKGGRVVAVLATGSSGDQKELMLHTIDLMQPLLTQVAIGLEHARLYQELVRERERLAVTLGSIGEGVLAVDAAGRVVLLNQAAEELIGKSRTETIGHPLSQVITDLASLGDAVPLQNILAGKQALWKDENILVKMPDGEFRRISATCTPMRRKDQSIHGAVLVARDVTLQRNIETETTRAQRLDSLGVLAGGIAHDFNNILGSVLLNVSLLQLKGGSSQDSVPLLGEIERALLHARELTQQLVTFSKEGQSVRADASLEELIRESAVFSLRGSGVECLFEIDDCDLWVANIDVTQINQVIQNLVLNAAQAMDNDGRISIGLKNHWVKVGDPVPLEPGPFVLCTITDEGQGIASEHLERIFDPYFTTKAEGTGLGLTSAYAIMARHEGWMTVDSIAGKGTSFKLYLPASRKGTAPHRSGEKVASGGKGRLLVMDDDEALVRAASRALSSLGFEVEGVYEGEEALELYRRRRDEGGGFDLVILDLTVPGGLGGKDTARALKELDPQIRLLASTGKVTLPSSDELDEWGFVDCVAKPYTVAELVDRIGLVLGNTS
jgi:PAS domain S-box-containing protein